MSKFISLSEKLFVKVDNIEAIEATDINTTKVYTANHAYDSSIAVHTLKSILELYKTENTNDNSEVLSEINNSMTTLRKSSQYFGG